MKFIDTEKLSPLEVKVFNELLNNAYPDLLNLSEFKIPTLELYQKSKLNENDDKNTFTENYE